MIALKDKKEAVKLCNENVTLIQKSLTPILNKPATEKINSSSAYVMSVIWEALQYSLSYLFIYCFRIKEKLKEATEAIIPLMLLIFKHNKTPIAAALKQV